MINFPLTPTAEELAQAREVYVRVRHISDTDTEQLTDPSIEDRARIYALIRLYPDVGALLGKLNLDAPAGFGIITVGLPNDPTYAHVFMSAEDFLAFAQRGEIVLGDQGYPDYIGAERLRHG